MKLRRRAILREYGKKNRWFRVKALNMPVGINERWYLYQMERRIEAEVKTRNIYNSIQKAYVDLAIYGNAAVFMPNVMARNEIDAEILQGGSDVCASFPPCRVIGTIKEMEATNKSMGNAYSNIFRLHLHLGIVFAVAMMLLLGWFIVYGTDFITGFLMMMLG